MMTQRRNRSTPPRFLIRGLPRTLLCLAPFGQGQAAPPIAPPAPQPEEVLLLPKAPTYQTLTSAEGDQLEVLSTAYTDGTKVQHPIGALITSTPLPLEILFLEAIAPAPHVTVLGAPGRRLDFRPETPFHVRIRQVPGFLSSEALLSAERAWESQAPRCLAQEWLALARVKGPTIAPMLPQGPPAQTTPYFRFGEFVCVLLREKCTSGCPNLRQ